MGKIRTGDVQVQGLRELNLALRSIGKEAQAELRGASKDVAETVMSDARALGMSEGGVAAKVAPSIRATAGVKSAGLGFGGAAYPFAAGAEFGSKRFAQFKPWRGAGANAGYFVYPAIRREAPRLEEDYLKAIDELMRKHGLK